ncbi:thioredoxin fold domain-containing protein [Marinomonas epiphytica]
MLRLSRLALGFLCVPWLLVLGMSSAYAGEVEIRAALSESLPAYSITEVSEHSSSGLYIVRFTNGNTLHTTADGRFFVAGDLYRVEPEGVVNETQLASLARLEKTPQEDMIVYQAANEKTHISVFTDVDCGYCRMLHKEIEELNELGITVRYLAFPRSGVGSHSYNKMVSVWCSDDPKKQLTLAKTGASMPENKCVNPVAEQLALGSSVGVRGTPTIITAEGAIIPGYLKAPELAKQIGL